MDSDARFKVAVLLGIVILVVDLLWLYGSFSHSGGAAYGDLPHNYTGAGAGYPSFNSSGIARGGGASGYMDVAYGAVILVADLAWLGLEFSKPKHSTKKR